MSNSFYITTPIYYVNDKPHIGHAYTTILCDSFARFNRFMGNDTFFLTGTDEHGDKVDQTAKSLGRDTKEHVDAMAERFREAWKAIHIEYDDFIRTTQDRHKQVVHTIIRKLIDSDDIYMDSYEGWYCVPCETFWTKQQLKNNCCPDCEREVKRIEEKNYFFRLAKYQEWLIDYINTNEHFIIPRGKKSEVLSFLKDPLEDLCISRPRERLQWGIPFPDNENFVIYVWFDALINYISAIGYSVDEARFNRYWPATIHMIGKDILRQHAIYWPIMLHAAGIPLPEHVIAHGWWTIEGDKMSKSLGNVVDPIHMSQTYGIDTFRYYMLREAAIGADGAYSEDLLIQRFNSDLANDLGNLVHRSISMLGKYFNGILPEVDAQDITHPIREQSEKLGAKIEKYMNREFDPRNAMSAVWRIIEAANKFVEDGKPWVLAKDDTKRHDLAVFMYTLLDVIRIIGLGLIPFLPHTAEKILTLLKQERRDFTALTTWGMLKPGVRLEKGAPLFPKIEDK